MGSVNHVLVSPSGYAKVEVILKSLRVGGMLPQVDKQLR